jgi:hypothetical protein
MRSRIEILRKHGIELEHLDRAAPVPRDADVEPPEMLEGCPVAIWF